MNDLSQHMKEEEADILPKLEEVLPQEDSEKYSNVLWKNRDVRPISFHPSAPGKPSYGTVVGLWRPQLTIFPTSSASGLTPRECQPLS
jgi:hypothetical protein